MKLSIGDRVKFLNEKGEGIVKGFIDAKTVNVMNDDDWEIPYPISEVVKVDEDDEVYVFEKESNNYQSSSSKKSDGNLFVKEKISSNKVQKTETSLKKSDVPDGKSDIRLMLVCENIQSMTDSIYRFEINNESNFILNSQLFLREGDTWMGHEAQVNRQNNEKICTIAFEQLQQTKEFALQLLFFRKNHNKLKAPYFKQFKINILELIAKKQFQIHPELKLPVYQIVIEKEDELLNEVINLDFAQTVEILREKMMGEQKTTPQPKPHYKPSEMQEIVDLHIGSLVDNENGMTPTDKLSLQMRKFKSELEHAIEKKLKSIVFIHGVGNGTLKLELRRTLDREYHQYKYQDASFQEYGYGATMVLLR